MSLQTLKRKFGQPTNSGAFGFSGSYADPIRNIDWILIAVVVLQSIIGLFNVFSTTHLRLIDQEFDPYFYTQRQAGYIIAAAAVAAIVMALGHEWFRTQVGVLYGGLMLLLVLVLVYGAVRGGARLSFNVPIVSFSLQPAEFVKPVILILIASYFSEASDTKIDWHHFVMSLYIVGAPVALILIQPDLGSATVIVAGVVGILLVAGARRRYLLMITGLSIATMGTVMVNGFIGTYQLRRLVSWLNQDSRDKALESVVLQVRFAKRAVSTGGFFGKGYLDGPLTNGKYIPVQFTDFPFSAIAEQFGMLGGGVVIALFAVMLWRVWRIAQMARDRFSFYMTCGIFTLMTFTIFQNIGMTLGLTPVSGLPLPFISYGGSHMLAMGIMVGLVQSVHMRRLE
ncbi:MAG: FtsW/RodA/SpoVE family cell cycle protein [Actinobacteria bacterium]|nr:FtsW/RodA/SpoVE family cell cycle protein [Actinomycetota bacterium]